MKLNLGCGANKLPDFVNVDHYGEPDVRHDLERFPWPWPDSSVDEVRLIHVLEHLGQSPATFIGVMKELYRVCAPGASIRIVVPHPRHDDFLGDPTHVRAVTSDTLYLFSRRINLEWKKAGAANTPLALYHDVDFEVVEGHNVLEPQYFQALQSGRLTEEALAELARERNNVVREIHMILKVIK